MKDINKIHLVSLGCPRNRVDSEVILGRLLTTGYSYTDEPVDAGLIIINTCAFIEDAKVEAIETIIEMSEYKKTGNLKKLVVTGCLSQRYKEELVNELEDVDLFVGTSDFHKIDSLLANNDRNTKLYTSSSDWILDNQTPRLNTMPQHLAYLKISEGCINKCSYCIIPSIRGSLRSRQVDDIKKEFINLSNNGIQEIILIAQDISNYGLDLDNVNLNKLLLELDKIKQIKWIRLLYLNPSRVTIDLLNVISNAKKIIPYFDIPVQHCSKKILKKMGRKGDYNSYVELFKTIRQIIPEAVLRTTLMTGFPGESNADFMLLKNFINEIKFDHLGVFTYSREEGTKSYNMKKQVKEELKNERSQILMELQKTISEDILNKYKGKFLDVIIDHVITDPENEIDKGLFNENIFNFSVNPISSFYSGRFRGQAPEIDGVTFFNSNNSSFMPGEIVKVKIAGSNSYDLAGNAEE